MAGLSHSLCFISNWACNAFVDLVRVIISTFELSPRIIGLSEDDTPSIHSIFGENKISRSNYTFK